jgi:hypothetical protein
LKAVSRRLRLVAFLFLFSEFTWGSCSRPAEALLHTIDRFLARRGCITWITGLPGLAF